MFFVFCTALCLKATFDLHCFPVNLIRVVFFEIRYRNRTDNCSGLGTNILNYDFWTSRETEQFVTNHRIYVVWDIRDEKFFLGRRPGNHSTNLRYDRRVRDSKTRLGQCWNVTAMVNVGRLSRLKPETMNAMERQKKNAMFFGSKTRRHLSLL